MAPIWLHSERRDFGGGSGRRGWRPEPDPQALTADPCRLGHPRGQVPRRGGVPTGGRGGLSHHRYQAFLPACPPQHSGLRYPQFAPAAQVSADFVVRTSGASYIPSGVDIEYYYVIQDDSGNSFETERYLLGYRDPRYEWQELRVENFTILWHDRPEKQVAQVAADVDHRLGAVRALFGLQEATPMRAVIFNDRREARLSFPVISGTATSRHVFGGFAFGEFDLFVLGGLDRDGMVHEMTHLLLDEAIDSPLARVPSWLNEGLAMYFESSSPGREVGVARAVRDRRSMPLRAMGSVPGRPADVSLFYAQARSVVKHMMDVHGAERMAALLGAINLGSRIDEAVPQVYGMTLEELEQEWQTTLTRETPRCR